MLPRRAGHLAARDRLGVQGPQDHPKVQIPWNCQDSLELKHSGPRGTGEEA